MPNLPLANIIDNLRDVGAQTGFSVQQFIAQCIAFIVLCVVLQKFAWNKVLVILDQRRNTIEQSMANAEKIKQELTDAEATRLSIIQKANEQANGLIAEAEKAAEARGEIVKQEATRQAEEIVRKAHEAAVLERDRLMAELKQQVGALVIQTTQKVAGKILTADDQTRLNNETLQQLNAPSN